MYRPGSVDTAPPPTIPADMAVRPGRAFPQSRCAANRDAGPVVILTNANRSARAGVVDVALAKARGYYEALCLDVKIEASYATENYPRVAANEAQFAIAGSFSELVDFAGRNNAQLVAVAVDGRQPLDALYTRADGPTELGDLRGRTFGVPGAVTPAVAGMLASSGLQRIGTDGSTERDYTEQNISPEAPELLTDPTLDALVGTRDDEGVRFDAAGTTVNVFDPAKRGIPGTFGVVYTNATFMRRSPTVIEDVLRATSRGLADALADPDAAVAAVAALDPAPEETPSTVEVPVDTPFETARWKVQSTIIAAQRGRIPVSLPLRSLLDREMKLDASIGLFGGVVPDIDGLVDDGPMRAVFTAGGSLVWPT